MKFRQARFQHANFDGFWVTLYLIFDGSKVYTLFDESDWTDNVSLMRESGQDVHTFAYEVLVTPTHLSDLYLKCKDVLKSNPY